jgi:hypothetical protein
MEKQLDFKAPADPPSGFYWCISDDLECLSWVRTISFAACRYCPGNNCVLGAYSRRMEELRVELRRVRDEAGWGDDFMVNPMHVGAGQDAVFRPHHLLIVGPFMNADLTKGQRMNDEIKNRGCNPHFYFYNRL